MCAFTLGHRLLLTALVIVAARVEAGLPANLEIFLRGLQNSMGLSKPDFSPMPRPAVVSELIAQGYRHEEDIFHHSLYDDATQRHVVVPYRERLVNWRAAEERVASVRAAARRQSDVSVLNNDAPLEYGYWDFLPRQLAVIPSNMSSVTFASPCFRHYTAQFTRIDEKGADLLVKVDQSQPYKNCTFLNQELLTFESSLGYPKVHEVAVGAAGGGVGQFEITMLNWAKDELEYIQKYGLFCSVWPLGAIGTVLSVLDTVELFVATDDTVLAKLNSEFMSERVNWTMKERMPEVVVPNATELRSGDTFSILRLDGLDLLVSWGTGGHTGHTAMVLKINGTVNVVESIAENPFGQKKWRGPFGVIITPYEQWMKKAVEANYIVDLSRLEKSRADAFDEKKAADFFATVHGSPYGYHNFIYSFFDTVANNLPWPISPAFFHGAMNIADRLSDNRTSPVSVFTLMTAGLNKRLSTSCIDMECINEALLTKELTFAEAARQPESDDWLYDGKRSMVCDVFVFEMLRAAGAINASLDIQATEQTPKDLYQMRIWDDTNDWFPTACKAAKTFNSSLPYCQLMGDYVLELNNFNTIELYPKMNENCESNPYYNYTRCPLPQTKADCRC